MLFQTTSPAKKRKRFRRDLRSGHLLAWPGAFSPLVALVIEDQGFDGVYVSGAALAADLGLPDIGLTTLSEVAGRGHQIARVTRLPTLIDIATGFGEPMNAARTIQTLEDSGLAGCHMEDQVNPKRCGHLDGKELVATPDMLRKLKAAVSARRDPNFVIIARTDSRAVEGLDAAVERAKAYVDAGADMIFPEALEGPAEFAKFRKAIKVPLLANMTEFGKSPLLTRRQLANLGVNLVIYPVTGLRLAMKAVEEGFAALRKQGTQKALLGQMQHRKRLYELLRYRDYNAFDTEIYDFEI